MNRGHPAEVFQNTFAKLVTDIGYWIYIAFTFQHYAVCNHFLDIVLGL